MQKNHYILILLCLCHIQCSDDKLDGKFISDSGSLINSIVFRDGLACVYGKTAKEMELGCFEYEIKGKSCYIIDPAKGSFRFDIIDKSTLQGVGWFKGTYRKE